MKSMINAHFSLTNGYAVYREFIEFHAENDCLNATIITIVFVYQ